MTTIKWPISWVLDKSLLIFVVLSGSASVFELFLSKKLTLDLDHCRSVLQNRQQLYLLSPQRIKQCTVRPPPPFSPNTWIKALIADIFVLLDLTWQGISFFFSPLEVKPSSVPNLCCTNSLKFSRGFNKSHRDFFLPKTRVVGVYPSWHIRFKHISAWMCVWCVWHWAFTLGTSEGVASRSRKVECTASRPKLIIPPPPAFSLSWWSKYSVLLIAVFPRCNFSRFFMFLTLSPIKKT